MHCFKQHYGKFVTFLPPHPSALTGCHLPLKGKALGVTESKGTVFRPFLLFFAVFDAGDQQAGPQEDAHSVTAAADHGTGYDHENAVEDISKHLRPEYGENVQNQKNSSQGGGNSQRRRRYCTRNLQEKEELEKDGIAETMKDELEAMEKALEMDKERFIRIKKDEIIPFIEEELATRYWFQEAGVIVRLRYDEQLKTALTKPLI